MSDGYMLAVHPVARSNTLARTFAASRMSTASAVSLSLPAGQPSTNYGVDNSVLLDLLQRTASEVPSVEAIEVFERNLHVTDTGVQLPRKHQVIRKTYSDFDTLRTLLDAKVGLEVPLRKRADFRQVPREQTLRVL